MTILNNASRLFFCVEIYRMYDGYEFPTKDFIEAENESEAMKIAHAAARAGEYSHDDVEEVSQEGREISYWSLCGGEVVKVGEAKQISRETFISMTGREFNI